MASGTLLLIEFLQVCPLRTLCKSKVNTKGENYRYVKLDISDIKEEADIAHVEYLITSQDRRSSVEYKLTCSAEMVKQGQAWKLKNAMSKMYQ